jgi:hypothetical protein
MLGYKHKSSPLAFGAGQISFLKVMKLFIVLCFILVGRLLWVKRKPIIEIFLKCQTVCLRIEFLKIRIEF